MTPSWVLCLETAVVGKICFWPLPGGTACELWSMEAVWMKCWHLGWERAETVGDGDSPGAWKWGSTGCSHQRYFDLLKWFMDLWAACWGCLLSSGTDGCV